MIKRRLKSLDYSLLIVYVVLSVFGLIMIYSASMVTSIQIYDVESDYFFLKQSKVLVLSYFICFVAAIIPYRNYKNNIFLIFMMLTMLAFLVGLLLYGRTVNNATSWISIFGFQFQPAEFVKLAIIVYLAAVYSKKQPYINDFNKGVIPPVVFLCFFCFLIVLQPDIGTAAIIFATGAIVVFCAGMNWKNLFKLMGIGIVIIAIFATIMSLTGNSLITQTRIDRFTSFMDPFKYELDEGLQLVNSYVAIGSGGITGVGLGKSIQKLGYLPEAHTDFIMAIIAEELGVFGVGFVLFCLGFIVLKGFHLGMKCKDAFGSLLAFGIAGLIGIQTFINLGGVSGLIPITGVTLPFVSYGGTSLIVLSGCMGLLLSVSIQANLEMKAKEKSKIN